MNAAAVQAPTVNPVVGVKGVNLGIATPNSMNMKRAQSAALMQLIEEQAQAKKQQAGTGVLGPATGQAPMGMGMSQQQSGGMNPLALLVMQHLMASKGKPPAPPTGAAIRSGLNTPTQWGGTA